MDQQHHIQDTTRTAVTPPRGGLPTSAWIIGGVMVAVIAGLAATLVLRGAPADTAPAAAVAELKPAAGSAKTAKPATNTGRSTDRNGGGDGDVDTRTAAAAPRTCANCGVVESVREVQVKGEGTGLGAVAGGVLGGVVGHQMGGGDGKKALTVLGAVGGGFAGHEVEKRARANTVYEVRVRMDDRSLRTLTSPQAPKTGTRVTVDGDVLRSAASTGG